MSVWKAPIDWKVGAPGLGQARIRFGGGPLLILLGILSGLPAVLIGWSLGNLWESTLVAKAEQEAMLTARVISQNVSLQAEECVRAVEMVAKQVEAWGTLDPAVLQRVVTTEKAAFPSLSLLYIGNSEGVSIAVDPPFDKFGTPNAGTDYHDRDYYQEVVRTAKIFISPVRIGRVSHIPNVQIAGPIFDRQGRLKAFAMGGIDVNVIRARVAEIVSDQSSLRVVILDRDGRTIVHPDKTAGEELRDLSKYSLFQPTTDPNGELRRGADESGAAVEAAVVPVTHRGLNWRVIAYEPEAAIRAEVSQAVRQVGMITAAGLAAGLMIGWGARMNRGRFRSNRSERKAINGTPENQSIQAPSSETGKTH